MPRYVVPLLLLLVLLVPTAASANGNNQGKLVRDCNQADEPIPWPQLGPDVHLARAGGVQAYAGRLKSRNNRVMCAWLVQNDTLEAPVGLPVTDSKLNRRQQDAPVFGDIWNRFSRRIDSFRVMASPGCVVNVKMWMRKNGKNRLLVNVTVWNKNGTKPKFKGFIFLPDFTDKVTKISTVSLGCPGLDLDYRE